MTLLLGLFLFSTVSSVGSPSGLGLGLGLGLGGLGRSRRVFHLQTIVLAVKIPDHV